MGPLEGKKIIEIAGIGPGPFCAMVLSDLGAEVIRVDRVSAVPDEFPATPGVDLLNRGRKSVAFDLKNQEGIKALLRLVEEADALIEGFRPGVAERLGIGPEECLERNPRLVYGRMTGWGQNGSMASAAGHDINYISLSGALHAIGEKDRNPTPPLNLVGDFGGGGMLLAFGIAAALFEKQKSGQGQVIDAAMTDGSALLMNAVFGIMNTGHWNPERGTNLLDGGAHFYGSYRTKDDKHISIGSIEPQFYQLLLEKTGLANDADLPKQMSRQDWPMLREKLELIFLEKTRNEWDEIMLGTDICYAPILTLEEAANHPHNKERGTFEQSDGVIQASPAPRFSRTSPEMPKASTAAGADTDEILSGIGASAEEIESLRASGAIA